jgi:type IV pilus assembly protein PilX
MMKKYVYTNNRQQGAVMIITLLILLLLTMIGVNAMQTNTQEEKMAGNMRDRNLAFEAAEAALRKAEQNIEILPNPCVFNGSNGLYGKGNSEPNYLFDNTLWTDTTSQLYTDDLSGVAEQPRYLIKLVKQFFPPDSDGGGIEITNTPRSEDELVSVFRITARGVGGSERSQVILQSHYGKAGFDKCLS